MCATLLGNTAHDHQGRPGDAIVASAGERSRLSPAELGYFDDEAARVEPIDYPFGPKVLPMCSE
jgi:hypothetical protein